MKYFSDINFVNYANNTNKSFFVKNWRFDNYYGIQYIYSGDIFVSIDNGPVEYGKPPAAFITYPGADFNYGSPPGKHRAQMHVCFSGKRVKNFIDNGLLELRRENIFIPIVDNERFMQSFLNLHHHLAMPGDLPHARAVLQLEEILLQLSEQKKLTTISTNLNSKISMLMEQIASNPERDWDFHKESSKLAISHVHFRRLFRTLSGLPPWKFLLECRLKQAEILLINSTLQIREIAERCKFDDEFHFSKFFKKHRGYSPSYIRKRFLFDAGE